MSEVLIGFDIDCCSVGFDGTHVYAIPRSRRALNYSVNLVDMSRRSYTYEARLIKYAQRKFAIAVPGLPFHKFKQSKKHLHPSYNIQCDTKRLNTIQPEQCQGLVKLLSAYHHGLLQTKAKHSHYINKSERIRRGEMKEKTQTRSPPKHIRDSRGNDYGWSPLWTLT
jgi:hypothetical protein